MSKLIFCDLNKNICEETQSQISFVLSITKTKKNINIKNKNITNYVQTTPLNANYCWNGNFGK